MLGIYDLQNLLIMSDVTRSLYCPPPWDPYRFLVMSHSEAPEIPLHEAPEINHEAPELARTTPTGPDDYSPGFSASTLNEGKNEGRTLKIVQKRRRCGLSPVQFWMLLLLVAMLVVGAAIGGALGGIAMHHNQSKYEMASIYLMMPFLENEERRNVANLDNKALFRRQWTTLAPRQAQQSPPAYQANLPGPGATPAALPRMARHTARTTLPNSRSSATSNGRIHSTTYPTPQQLIWSNAWNNAPSGTQPMRRCLRATLRCTNSFGHRWGGIIAGSRTCRGLLSIRLSRM